MICITQGESWLLTPFSPLSLSFTLLPFLLYFKKLFTEAYFAPGTILVLPVLQDIDTLIILTIDEDIEV